ncbi:MAG TPA: hypothetical protein VHT96_13445 [Clostridia bacterium]|nr:hypothetical protein [Clostridia bacterium]
MEVIILVALIFVILSLANKYLKVPRDNNQRYDGINNRFYGEGYTGDTPVPPTDAEGQENVPEDLQGDLDEDLEDQQENQDEDLEDQTEEQQGDTSDNISGDLQEDISNDMKANAPGNLNAGLGDQPDNDVGETGAMDRPDADHVSVSSVENASGQGVPAGNAAIYGNDGNTQGVIIDTEVHTDAVMPQDPVK